MNSKQKVKGGVGAADGDDDAPADEPAEVSPIGFVPNLM